MTTYRARPQKDPEPEPVHDYSSTQVNITGKPAQMMRAMADRIPQADIGPDGREDQPHITAKWGLHFQSPTARMRSALQRFGPVEAILERHPYSVTTTLTCSRLTWNRRTSID